MPPNRLLTPQEWAHLKMIKEFEEVVPQHQGADWLGMAIRPHRTRFATQNKGEKAYILARTHWTLNLGWITSAVLYALIPLVLSYLLNYFNFSLGTQFSIRVQIVLLLTYYSLVVSNIFRRYVSWYYNFYLITNERIMVFKFNPATFTRDVNETRLDMVTDVKSRSVGILASFFNYGHVTIYTEAERNELNLDQVSDSTKIRDIIADLAKIASKYSESKE